MTGPLTIALPAEAVEAIAQRAAEIVVGLEERAAASAASPYMTVAEAAEYLRCPRQRIDDLLSQRRLTRVKDGGRTLIRRDEIESYLERQMWR